MGVSVAAACGDDGGNVPIDAPAGMVDAPADAMTDAPVDAPNVMAAAMIGPGGGTVSAPGFVSLAIPPGALGQSTMITRSPSRYRRP